MKVQLLVRQYNEKYGLARYTSAITKALTEAGLEYSVTAPVHPFLLRAAHRMLAPIGLDTRRFFTTYPLAAQFERGALKHLTTQQMGTLLWFSPSAHPAVITVHDIVPYLVRHDREQSAFRHPVEAIFDKLAMKGLKRADRLIAISEFTKQTLVEALACPEDKIEVVLYGVDHSTFRPVRVSDNFRARYSIDEDYRHILYVGAESPRKNLLRLVQAFALLKERMPAIRLVKVGTPAYIPQWHELQELMRDLELEDSFVLINHPPEEHLVALYCMADLFAFPSLYEGFGMPPLEAMACGTPVVCSSAASLPEVVGDAALMVDPTDVEGLAGAMHRMLTDADLREELRARGLERAKQFTWERTAQETVSVYRKVLDLACAAP